MGEIEARLIVGVIGGATWIERNHQSVYVSLRPGGEHYLLTLTPAPLQLLVFLALHPGEHEPKHIKEALYGREGQRSWDHARQALLEAAKAQSLLGAHLINKPTRNQARFGLTGVWCDLIELLRATNRDDIPSAQNLLSIADRGRGGHERLSPLVPVRWHPICATTAALPAPNQVASFPQRFNDAIRTVEKSARITPVDAPSVPLASPVGPSIRRPGRRMATVAGVAAILISGGLGWVLTQGGSTAGHCTAGVAATNPADDAIQAARPSGTGPHKTETVTVGIKPVAAAAGHDGVWVAWRQGVTRIDSGPPARAGAPIAVAENPQGRQNAPFALALTRDRVWVTRHDGVLVSIDRLTQQVVGKPVRFGTRPATVAVDGRGGVWVNNYGDAFDGEITRIDACTGAITRVSAGRQANTVYAAFGSLWVTNGLDRSLQRIDPVRRRVIASIPGFDDPQDVVAADGEIWVNEFTKGRVQRVDPRTNRKVGPPLRIGPAPAGAAVGANAIWVPLSEVGRLTRIRLPRGHADVGIVDAGTTPLDVVVAFGRLWVPDSDGSDVIVLQP